MFLMNLILLLLFVGCTVTMQDADPAKKFIGQMDKAPPEKRVPNWEQTKALMARPAPSVGSPAPDFTLPSLDGRPTATLSQHKGERPVVLVFGSFT